MKINKTTIPIGGRKYFGPEKYFCLWCGQDFLVKGKRTDHEVICGGLGFTQTKRARTLYKEE